MAYPRDKDGKKLCNKSSKAPRPGVPFSKKCIANLIQKHCGNISRIADTLGSCRGPIRRFIDAHPDLKEMLVESRERQLDELEESCFNRAIKTNDTTLQLFLLKTQGKARGYDQNEAQHAAKDIATAAFDFILSKQSK